MTATGWQARCEKQLLGNHGQLASSWSQKWTGTSWKPEGRLGAVLGLIQVFAGRPTQPECGVLAASWQMNLHRRPLGCSLSSP